MLRLLLAALLCCVALQPFPFPVNFAGVRAANSNNVFLETCLGKRARFSNIAGFPPAPPLCVDSPTPACGAFALLMSDSSPNVTHQRRAPQCVRDNYPVYCGADPNAGPIRLRGLYRTQNNNISLWYRLASMRDDRLIQTWTSPVLPPTHDTWQSFDSNAVDLTGSPIPYEITVALFCIDSTEGAGDCRGLFDGLELANSLGTKIDCHSVREGRRGWVCSPSWPDGAGGMLNCSICENEVGQCLPPVEPAALGYCTGRLTHNFDYCALPGVPDPGNIVSRSKISRLSGGPAIEGILSNSLCTYGVASPSDLDGDGYEDLVALGNVNATVLFLNPSTSPYMVRETRDMFDMFSGLLNNTGYIRSVESVGDWDGDGVAEIAVGTTNDQVYIVYLHRNGTAKRSAAISGFTGLEFGYKVVYLGLDNVTGHAVLAVGAPAGSGSTFVLFVDPQNMNVVTLRNISTDGGYFASSIRFGSRIARLGDLDGDGVPLDFFAGPVPGFAGCVFFLIHDGRVKRMQCISTTPDSCSSSLPAGFSFSKGASAGDRDGDGYADLVFNLDTNTFASGSAQSFAFAFLNCKGEVHGCHVIIQGAEQALSGVGYSESEYTGLGSSPTPCDHILPIFDFDGNGIDDVACSESNLPNLPAIVLFGIRNLTNATSAASICSPDAQCSIPGSALVPGGCSNGSVTVDEAAFTATLGSDLGVAPYQISVLPSSKCSAVNASDAEVSFEVAAACSFQPPADVNPTYPLITWNTGFFTTAGGDTAFTPPVSAPTEPAADASGIFESMSVLFVVLIAVAALACLCSVVALLVLVRHRNNNTGTSSLGGSADGNPAGAIEMAAAPPTRCRVTGRLGKGNFGTVWAATTSEGIDIALKELNLESMDFRALEELQRESKLLAQCSHKFVVRYLFSTTSQFVEFDPAVRPSHAVDAEPASREDDDLAQNGGVRESEATSKKAFIAMERCLGPLDRTLKAQQLSIGAYLHIMWQAAVGMNYLAKKHGIIHRDLALRNLLVGDAGAYQTMLSLEAGNPFVVKIADFGLSRVVPGGDYSAYYSRNEVPLPLRWTSGEALLRGRFSSKSDSFAFGVTLLELLRVPLAHLLPGGAVPFGSLSNDDIIAAWQAASRLEDSDTPEFVKTEWKVITKMRAVTPEISGNSDLPHTLRELIFECCAVGPSARPSFGAISKRLSKIILECGDEKFQTETQVPKLSDMDTDLALYLGIDVDTTSNVAHSNTPTGGASTPNRDQQYALTQAQPESGRTVELPTLSSEYDVDWALYSNVDNHATPEVTHANTATGSASPLYPEQQYTLSPVRPESGRMVDLP